MIFLLAIVILVERDPSISFQYMKHYSTSTSRVSSMEMKQCISLFVNDQTM
jgi:hypothetical protein